MRTRTLSLRRETLSDLTADDLATVAGGERDITWRVKQLLSIQPYQCV